MKRLLSFILIVVLAFTSLPFSVLAQTKYCTGLYGTNKNHQDYYNYADVVKSYLSVASDGKLMNVIYDDGQLKIAYYTSQFELIKTLVIKNELPFFGGFYETENNYYVLSGQNNPNEDASVEVFRVTKYSKNWERIGSVGLYGANTTIPFRAGSARFAHTGNILFVRTCHQMYKSDDGLNHQANVTFSVNTDTMSIINSFYGVMNVNYGYVSHSFNQFIKYADNRLLAVDHGDAYPRSVCFLKYSESAYKTYGIYTDQVTTMLDIPGAIGTNYTGVTVGGFEVSPSSYLVVGTSKIESQNKNVFVSVLNKNSTQAQYYYLTNYTGTDASTPHLVKITDEYYMVLWSSGGYVYYQVLNQYGQKHGSLYKIKGSLSDCAPVAHRGKVQWYTYNGNDVTFYYIYTSSLSKNGIKTVNDGHEFIHKSTSSEHWYECTECGQKQTSEKHSAYTDFTSGNKLVTKCGVCNRTLKSLEVTITLNESVSKQGEQILTPVLKTSDGKTLKKDNDYFYYLTDSRYSYSSGIWCRSHITYKFYKNYSNYITKTFADLSVLGSVIKIKTQVYTGKEIKPSVKVRAEGKILKKGTDYTVSYKNNKKVGTATVIIKGKGSYFGTIKKTFKIARSISKAKVTNIVTKPATSKSITQNPKVVLSGKTLKKNKDYTLSYKNNVKSGVATLTIKGKGNYTGTIKKTFVIRPKTMSVNKLTSTAKRKAVVKWKKTSGVNGYQIIYSIGKKFSSKKTVSVSSSRSSYTITKLKSRKTYYVKIRSYKVIKGKRYYSNYSKVKTVRVK